MKKASFKKVILKTIKYISVLCLTFIASVIIYLLSAKALSSIRIEEEKNQPKEVTIYISTNGMHTDIIMPIKNEKINWSDEIKYSHTVSKDSTFNYVALGWGDQRFFLDVPDWDHVKASIALKAGLGMNPTAIHSTYLYRVTEDETCKKIVISYEQYSRLVDYIQSYFKRDKNGNIINIITPNVYGKTDSFYEANRNYHIFFTCNTWANKALKVSGLRACMWTPFQQGIFNQYKESM